MSADNWSNLSTFVCRTCMYFVPKRPPLPAPTPPPSFEPGAVSYMPRVPEPVIGRCRRHAPTLGGWPVVYESDWCGDHKLR